MRSKKRCIDKFYFQISKQTENNNNNLYYFLLPISKENIVFGSNFRRGDFDGFMRLEVP